MSRRSGALAAVAAVIISLASFAAPASAHDRRTVGPYQFVVGFLNEPAFAGTVNGVELTVSDTRAGNKPVEGVEKTLTVEVRSGGLSTSLALPLASRFGQPGKYAAYFMPTKDGSYTFTFKGKIDSTDVNERFESGPGRFNDVQSPVALQYPDKVPAGSELSGQLADLRSAVDQARLLSIVAIVVTSGALGLALLRRRT